MPAMVEVRLASARLVCAVVRLVCAVVTEALSESIWLVVALLDWSVDSLSCAEVSEACADSTAT